MNDTVKRFNDAMIELYKLAVRECNYRAKAFLSMVVEMGSVPAAKNS